MREFIMSLAGADDDVNRVMLACQMSLGCFYDIEGDRVTVNTFAEGDDQLIIEALEDANCTFITYNELI